MMISYAVSFVAYLLKNLKDIESIREIILYGSVAQGSYTEESDVDLFIVINKKGKIEAKIKDLEGKFYETREASLFKVQNIENKFSIKIGRLEDWEDLYRSIISTGIVLYGKYAANKIPKGMQHGIIIFWEKIQKNRGSFLNKLYGFTVYKKHYNGILDEISGKRIGKSSILIPIKHKDYLFKLLRKYDVEAHSIEVFY